MVQTVCERNVRSPGTCFYQVADADRSLVPLDRGLSASGSFEQLSVPELLLCTQKRSPATQMFHLQGRVPYSQETYSPSTSFINCAIYSASAIRTLHMQ